MYTCISTSDMLLVTEEHVGETTEYCQTPLDYEHRCVQNILNGATLNGLVVYQTCHRRESFSLGKSFNPHRTVFCVTLIEVVATKGAAYIITPVFYLVYKCCSTFKGYLFQWAVINLEVIFRCSFQMLFSII
jgi:hypothetical protein